MKQNSSLPPLHTPDSRQYLTSQSSDSSFFSKSRRSSSSFASFGSDLQSNASSAKMSHPFTSISYFSERRVSSSPEVLKKCLAVQKKLIKELTCLVSEKSEIKVSIEREKDHIDALIQESEERESRIRETLEVLKANTCSRDQGSKPPSINQIRRISNLILSEGMKFKQLSKNQQTIEREIRGAESLNNPNQVDMGNNHQKDTMDALSALVFQLENSQFRLNTTMSNRDMLIKVTLDHRTNLEALKQKSQNLMDEGKKLEREFQEQLVSYAQIIGEMMWKNEVVKASNEIARLPKYST